MFKLDKTKEDVLKRFMIQIPGGTTLFKQNDKGNTLYVVVEGSVKLTQKTTHYERNIGTLGPGEIVGERALYATGPYRRPFTAIAEMDSVALEFDSQSLKAIAAKTPDFSLKLLEVTVERLERANTLIAILQIPNMASRIGQYLLFLCEHHSKKGKTGAEIVVTNEEIQTATNSTLEVVADCIKELVGKKIVSANEKGYNINDTNSLLEHLLIMEKKIAA